MARPRFRPTEQHRRLVYGMAMIGMYPIHIAPLLGISPSTLLKYFTKQIEAGILAGKSKIARVATEMAHSGKYPKVTKFWLETVGASLENVSYTTRKGPIGKTVWITDEPPEDGEPYRRDSKGRYIQERIWPDQRRVDEQGRPIRHRRRKAEAENQGGEHGESET